MSGCWWSAKTTDVGFYRELVRNMGVAEYLHKPLTRDHVARLFVPQIAGITIDAATRAAAALSLLRRAWRRWHYHLAVNLALQLATSTRGHVALLDLHLRQGTTALMLGVKPEGGLRIALEQPERADALFLDRVAVEVDDRLRLIAADEALDGTPRPRRTACGACWTCCVGASTTSSWTCRYPPRWPRCRRYAARGICLR